MNTISEWIQALTPFFTSIAAILAVILNMLWSKERFNAKDAEIQSIKTQRDSEIQSKESEIKAIKTQKEAETQALKSEIESLKTQLDLLKSFTSSELPNHLREQIKEFEKQTNTLKSEVTTLKKKEKEKSEQIAKLSPSQDASRIKQLEEEKLAYNKKIRELEAKINDQKVTETTKVISVIEKDIKSEQAFPSAEKITTYLNAAAVISGTLALFNAIMKEKK